MNENMSEMINNFSKMMNNQDMSDNMKNFFNSINNTTNNENPSNMSNNNNSDDNSNNSTDNTNSRDSSNTNNIFGNIDMSTIIKMQQIMNSLNDKQNDSRTNLLLSLKPYLKEHRKKKVDQYIQLMKMGKIFEMMNPLGGDNKHV